MTLTDSPAPTNTDAAPTPPISVQMRDGSRAQHEAAEASTFVGELMAGRISSAGYVAYLRSLREVYVALEDTGRLLADHPVAGRLVDPRLDRVPALDADIAVWSTGDPAEDLVASTTAAAYADLITATAARPELFPAHHYTRYLGDLSGGQAIGRVLDREFDLEGRGIELYRFEGIEKVKPYKDDYRARLDSLPLDAFQQGALVGEVQASFSANQAIFAELAEHLDTFAR